MSRWRVPSAVLLVAAYALASHWMMLHAADRPWAVAALFGPLLALMLGAALLRRHWPCAVAALALVAILVRVVARGGVEDIDRLYVLQYLGLYLVLIWSFGITLRRGSTALITTFAQHVHGDLPLAMRAYTRRLTVVWVGYFIAMVLIALALYAWAPWSWWSLFANVLTPVALLVLFVGEHLLRYRLHPEFERATLMAAVRAYRRVNGTAPASIEGRH